MRTVSQTIIGMFVIVLFGYPLNGQTIPPASGLRLARVTFYTSDGEPGGHFGSTGVRLEEGKHVAVDPSVIPYGAEVSIPGLGSYVAVDCGTAVKARTAARKAAAGDSQKAEAIVVDVFVKKRDTMLRVARSFPMYVEVAWQSPSEQGATPDAIPTPAAATDGVATACDVPTSRQTAQDDAEQGAWIRHPSNG